MSGRCSIYTDKCATVPNPGMESVQIVEFANGKSDVDLSWEVWPRETCALGVKLLRMLSFSQSQQNFLLVDPINTFAQPAEGDHWFNNSSSLR